MILYMQPLALARRHCRTPVLALAPTAHPARYLAATPHGSMALFLEHAHWLPHRNGLLRQGRLGCPLVYEQVEVEEEGGWVSLTLTELVEEVEGGGVSQLQAEDLVDCAYRISRTQFDYHPDCYRLTHILQSVMTRRLYFDFTCIVRRDG